MVDDAAVDLVFKLQSLWMGMHGRCNSPKHRSYKDYGAKGIKLSPEWSGRQGSMRFVKWALKNGYQPGLDIDRIRQRGSYGSHNCRFVTRKVNCQNKTNNRMITYKGETKCLAAWSDDPRCVVPRNQFQQRIACGWKIERALLTPLRKR